MQKQLCRWRRLRPSRHKNHEWGMRKVEVPASCVLDPSHQHLHHKCQQRHWRYSRKKLELVLKRQEQLSMWLPSIFDGTSTRTNQRLHLVNRSIDGLKSTSESIPMRGCATSPLIGPASQTRLVTCSDMPSDRRKGVPYLVDATY